MSRLLEVLHHAIPYAVIAAGGAVLYSRIMAVEDQQSAILDELERIELQLNQPTLAERVLEATRACVEEQLQRDNERMNRIFDEIAARVAENAKAKKDKKKNKKKSKKNK